MRNTILSSIVLLITFSLSGQEIKIIKQADSLPKVKERGLIYIHPETDLQNYFLVGSVEISDVDFYQILSGLQSIAVDLFANAFKYIEHKNVGGKTSVTFDLYSVSQNNLEANKNYRETNVIYFFGNDKKPQKFKIDDRKIELKENEIFKYEIPKNKEIKINKGGLTGMTLFHQWRNDQPVIFYAFGSGNISFSGNGYSSIGLKVNTGNILELKSDFAYLLMVLKKWKLLATTYKNNA